MEPTMAATLAIFHELGWNKAEPDQVPTLPLGSKEQQKIAKQGLSKGDWLGGDIDRGMLGNFAIRLGVPARRAVTILGWARPGAHPDVVAVKDEAWIHEFIRRGCSSKLRR